MNYFAKLKEENTILHSEENVYGERYEMVPPGVYKLEDYGGAFERIYAFTSVKTPDNLIKFKEGIIIETISKIKKFLSPEIKKGYLEMKISHKIGIILYGPHGTGKTSISQLLMEEIVENFGAICLICTSKKLMFIKGAVELLRNKGFEGPICIFVDEVEDSFNSEENRYLTFLDGQDSYEGLIFIGCTNYLDKISDRIKDRKSRIKYCIEINKMPDSVYRQYISEKIPSLPKEEVEKIVYHVSEAKLNIDQVKHVLIDHKLEKIPLQEAIDTILSHEEKEKK